jgi:two-component system, LytTR family, sensor kinase
VTRVKRVRGENSIDTLVGEGGGRDLTRLWLAAGSILFLYFITAHWFAFRRLGVEPTNVITVAVTDAISWAAMAAFGVWLSRRPEIRSWPWTHALPALLLATIGFVLLRLIVLQELGRWLGWEYPFTLLRRLIHLQPEHVLFIIIFIGAGLALRATAEAAAMRRNVNRLRLEIAEADFRRLRSGLRPHLLFGSLAAIRGQIGRSPRDAVSAIVRLGDLLRYSMRSARRTSVALREEAEHLQKYVATARDVLGHSVELQLEMEPGTEETAIPPMLLLHLADAWIGSGGQPPALNVTAERIGDEVAVRVSAPGAAIPTDALPLPEAEPAALASVQIRRDEPVPGTLTLLLPAVSHEPTIAAHRHAAPAGEEMPRSPGADQVHPRAIHLQGLVLACVPIFLAMVAMREFFRAPAALSPAARAEVIASRSIMDAFFYAAVFLFLFAVLRAGRGRWSIRTRVALAALAVVVATALATAGRYGVFCQIAAPGRCWPFSAFMLHQSPFMAIFAVAFAGIGIGIIVSRRDMAAANHAMLLRADAVEARVRSLTWQLQPHFLFNALNSVASLVASDPAAARRMLRGLEELLELSLHRSDALELPLEEEIEFLTTYLGIEGVRFQDRLVVEIDVPTELQSACVPFMLLQPLVENAIRHAIARTDHAGVIRIRATEAAGMLELSVSDNGGPAGSGMGSGEGIGWSNTRDRLRELYGGRHHFRAESPEGVGLEVTIRIPLRGAVSGGAVEVGCG